MNKYKVSISPSPGWQRYSLCSLDISIGNERETGDKLEAALEWIDKRFDHCVINLGDTLFRHSLSENIYDKEKARIKAAHLGDLWLHENKDALAAMKTPYTVTRWDDWLKHSDFEQVHGDIWGEYFQSSAFRNAVKTDVDSFIERNEAKGEQFSQSRRSNCLFYIMEELAVHSIMSSEFMFARLYTANRLQSAVYLSQASGALSHEAYVKLNFKKRKDAGQQVA